MASAPSPCMDAKAHPLAPSGSKTSQFQKLLRFRPHGARRESMNSTPPSSPSLGNDVYNGPINGSIVGGTYNVNNFYSLSVGTEGGIGLVCGMILVAGAILFKHAKM